MRPEVKGETLACHSNSKLSLLVIVVKAIKTKTFRKIPENSKTLKNSERHKK